jgi:hypothetical protein
MTDITQEALGEAERLADLVCGCATREQNRKDVAEIEAALLAAEQRGMERAAVIAEEFYMKAGNPDFVPACRTIGRAIRTGARI